MSDSPRGPLAELIETRRRELGLSYAQLAERSGLKLPNVYKLATAELRAMPKPETITGLAAGLSLPAITVLKAAGRAAGYGEMIPQRGDDALEIADQLMGLGPEQRLLVRSVIDGLVRRAGDRV